jgi:hypothetical protein
VVGRVVDDQRERSARRGALQNWPSRVTIACDPQLNVLLVKAAAARDMSLAGYARRALCAFLAHDLGMDFAQVCALTPKPAPAGQVAWGRLSGGAHPSKNPGRWADDGLGYGTWEVCS